MPTRQLGDGLARRHLSKANNTLSAIRARRVQSRQRERVSRCEHVALLDDFIEAEQKIVVLWRQLTLLQVAHDRTVLRLRQPCRRPSTCNARRGFSRRGLYAPL